MVLTNNATGTKYDDDKSLGSDELTKETKFGLDISTNTLIRGKLKLNTNKITTQTNNFVTIPDSTDTLDRSAVLRAQPHPREGSHGAAGTGLRKLPYASDSPFIRQPEKTKAGSFPAINARAPLTQVRGA